ncbi:YtxH domain-containing protein [Streptomyces sp. NPDC012888]|uniref:YtxH domain-containing protein n=1 Tax=Streptomyces sp. NPDC012888 TaxID=3364855 RepID=UPI0036D1BDE2
MRYKVVFAVGLAFGYVLGTRAGRERYEEMRKSAREIARNPAVRNAAEQVGQTGREVAGKAFAAVGDRIPASVAGRVRSLRERGQGYDDDWGTSNT